MIRIALSLLALAVEDPYCMAIHSLSIKTEHVGDSSSKSLLQQMSHFSVLQGRECTCFLVIQSLQCLNIIHVIHVPFKSVSLTAVLLRRTDGQIFGSLGFHKKKVVLF